MTDLNRINSSNLDAYLANATTPTVANRDTGAFTTWGVTLLSNSTYYFPLGAPRSAMPAETTISSVHMWGHTAGLIITSAIIEDSNMFSTRSPDGRGDVVVFDSDNTNVGAWIPEIPAAGAPSFVGTGWSSSASQVTAAGTGVGGAMFHLGNMGSRRARLKVVTGATGGVLQVAVHGKGGS